MAYSRDELAEAKRQIDSTLHKLQEAIRSLEAKEHPERRKAQITLAKRRVNAFQLAVSLIEAQLEAAEAD